MSRKARDRWIKDGAALPVPDAQSFVGPLHPLDAEEQAFLERDSAEHGEALVTNAVLVRRLDGAFQVAEAMGDDPFPAQAFPVCLEKIGKGDPMAILAAIALSKLDTMRRKNSRPATASRSGYDGGRDAPIKEFALVHLAALRAEGIPKRRLLRELRAAIAERFAFERKTPSDSTLRRWISGSDAMN